MHFVENILMQTSSAEEVVKHKERLLEVLLQFEKDIREEDTTSYLVELIKEYRSKISIILYDLYDLKESCNETVNT